MIDRIRLWRAAACIIVAQSVSAIPARSQLDTAGAEGAAKPDSVEWARHLPPGGDDETYLRYLQIVGAASVYPWSSRAFSPVETGRLTAVVGTHPWSRTPPFTVAGRRASVLPFSTMIRANSGFPYGSNDGPVWAGRGLTASSTAGISLRAGPLSLVLAPMAFVAQNASFDLLENGQSGDLRFADGLHPTSVDRPQRFGEGAYVRVDPGNSTLRGDFAGLAAGISTANMAWGPSELYPILLGTNAAGFLHGFVGTARPVNVWLGSLHGKVIWGRLEQSGQSPVEGTATYTSSKEAGTRRFASGLVLLFAPGRVRGLELGVARFFHSPWPASGIPPSYFRKPFEGVLKNKLKGSPEFADPNTSADNQLISGFARWVFPQAGFEMYAEYGREDHSWDKRDFVQEPDHSRAYGLGFRKTLRLLPTRMDGLTVELINFQLPPLVRTLRGEQGLYVHGIMRQGHTHRGQLLGADVGVDAASGFTMRWDRYVPAGRTSFALHRQVRQERGEYYKSGVLNPDSPDVQYALAGERRRRFRGVDVTLGMTVIRELNRNFRDDVTAVSGTAGVSVPLAR